MSSRLPQRILRGLALATTLVSIASLAGFAYGALFFHAHGIGRISTLCLGYAAIAVIALAFSRHVRRRPFPRTGLAPS